MRAMILIAAEMTAAPGRRAEMMQALEAMLAPTRAETGCLDYRLFVDVEHDDKVLFFERWVDEAAIDAHFASPHFQHLTDIIPELVAEPPAIRIYEVGREVQS